MANINLSNAKTAKNDEFYTQYADIQKEINAYLDYDPDVFRGKTVLLPCDDPEWSNFTKFFAQNFELLGLKKLISTSYAPESKRYKLPYQPTLFETSQPYFNPDKTKTNGKIFVLERDITGDNRININDLEWQYLEGDGDRHVIAGLREAVGSICVPGDRNRIAIVTHDNDCLDFAAFIRRCGYADSLLESCNGRIGQIDCFPDPRSSGRPLP